MARGRRLAYELRDRSGNVLAVLHARWEVMALSRYLSSEVIAFEIDGEGMPVPFVEDDGPAA